MSRHANLAVALALIILTFGTFARVYRNDFVRYDDPHYLTENSIIQQGFTKAGLVWAFGKIHGENTYWHPLTWVSHMIDVQLFGMNPAGHHLISLTFHAANAALLFLILQSITGTLWRSAIVAALFAVHPLQVESFAWATERKNVLSAFFFMLTLWFYQRYAKMPSVRRYLLSLAAFALGLMSKPAIVPVPGVLLLLDYWPLRRLQLGSFIPDKGNSVQHSSVTLTVTLKRVLLEKVPFVLLASASALLTIWAHKGLGMLEETVAPPRQLQWGNAALSYLRYLQKTLWPGDLAVFYPFPKAISTDVLLLCLFFLLGFSAIAVWRVKRQPWLVVGWFWFIGLLTPTIGIIPVGIQAMADRFVYLPIVGLLVMAVWAANDWIQRLNLSRLATGFIAVVPFLALIPMAYQQVGYWKSDYAMWERARTAVRDNYMAYTAVGGILCRQGKLDEGLYYLGVSLDIEPRFAHTYYLIGVARYKQGNVSEAISNFEHSLLLRPDELDARLDLALALQAAGRLDESINQYRLAIERNPNIEPAHLGLGNALLTKGLSKEAIDHLNVAIRLNPKSDGAMARLGWILATHQDSSIRNGAEAVRLATKACQLTEWQQAQNINTLAAAYAETGQFELAIRTAEQAVEVARSKGQANLVPIIESLRERYRRHEPYREGST